MKIYQVAWTVKILVIFTFLFIFIGGIFFILFYNDSSSFQKILFLTILIFGALGVVTMFSLRVHIDDKRIEFFILEILAIFLGKTSGITHQVLDWSEIEELGSIFVLFPETPIITLKPKPYLNKKPIQFMGMPIELVHDILSHLPPDVKVNLYPYLKRKLEGKQTWFYIK